MGLLLLSQGEYGPAHSYLVEGLEMRGRLYPKERYPHGHAHLAQSLNDMGSFFVLLSEHSKARMYYEKALAMIRRLYAKEQYPAGNPHLATGLNNFGQLLFSQGDYDLARTYFEEALAMRRQLYTKEQYPWGHPYLAQSLRSLGSLLRSRGEYGQARDYLEEAAAIFRRVYPQGHPDLARSLSDVGLLLVSQGEHVQARTYYEKALAMIRRLYPKEQYPHGHPQLASTLGSLGFQLWSQGEYADARRYFDEALAICRRLYSKNEYPHGHSRLAGTVENLGGLLHSQGEYGQARMYLEEALAMYQSLAEVFFADASEAEALNFAAHQPLTRDGLLSVCLRLDEPTDKLYDFVWHSRGAIGRVIARRHQTLTARADRQTKLQYGQYLKTRRQLARLALAPAEADPQKAEARGERLQELGENKERMERTLAAALPEFRTQFAADRSTPNQLIKELPAGTVFVDLLSFTLFEQDPNRPGKKGARRRQRYVAFVLRTQQPIVRIELGPVAPIDTAVNTWRKQITATAEAASRGLKIEPAKPGTDEVRIRLRRLIWNPIEKHLPKDTTTVLLCPDGRLTGLPWSALPGRKPNSFLVEDYALGIVPRGQFALARLLDRTSNYEPESMLAVGGVDYDAAQQNQTATVSNVHPGLRSPVRDEEQQIQWSGLPGTMSELAVLSKLAADRRVLQLSGTSASTSQLLQHLPTARWAHIATHGFFANPKFRSAFQLDPKLFSQPSFLTRGERYTVVGRNPLVLSGLVLAGANRPRPTDSFGIPKGDGGIVTAEGIAGLPLHSLELVVLSACETGIGDVAGGEGVFGLQRAFHIAGAKSVIASLWKVDDKATRALMTEFYRNLWQKKLGKLEALRQAQLAMILRFDPANGQLRAPSVVPSGQVGRNRSDSPRPGTSLSPFFWGAFVLSGDWR